MGITRKDSIFLFFSKTLEVNYENTLMLGRQQLYASKEDIAYCLHKFGNAEKKINEIEFPDEYSEPLFYLLGSKNIQSIDFSDYEKATIVHDMNVPIPDKYVNLFNCVIDSGTLEHIFNFPVAIKNCMDAIKPGGHFIGITPANNHMGHGFYQFSPELYYRVFSKENGFRIKKMLISISNNNDSIWYEVSDPKDVNSRVMLENNYPLSIFIIAEKTENKKIFATIPQQNDYTNTWNAYKSVTEKTPELGGSVIKYIFRSFFPKRVKTIIRNIYDIVSQEKQSSLELGTINSKHFKKIEL